MINLKTTVVGFEANSGIKFVQNISTEFLKCKHFHCYLIVFFPSFYGLFKYLILNIWKCLFQSLLGETDSGSGSRSDEIDDKYSSAKDAVNRNKNRYSNILACK
jgi:hypothetical protein